MKKIIFLMIFVKLMLFAMVKDEHLLTVVFKDDFSNYSNLVLFINNDNNSDTGYSKDGILGADLLIQNKTLFKRTQDSSRWNHWKKISDVDVHQNDDKLYLKIILDHEKAFDIGKYAKIQALSYDDKYIKSKRVDIKAVSYTKNHPKKPSLHHKNKFIVFKKSKDGILIDSIDIAGKNILASGSKIFKIVLKDLKTGHEVSIDSISGWKSVELGKEIIFSNPKDSSLPKRLKVIATINQTLTKSKWDLEVKGVGFNHSIVDIDIPSLRFKKLPFSKFLIPKYTGKLIDVENDDIKRDMLYPCGWTSTMQYLAYYNHNAGVYIGNHDPYASTKRFIIKKDNNIIEYSTKITPPNKTLPNNNFKLSGSFELDSFNGDWYDASLIYKSWASKEAKYWPKMTKKRIKSQHKLGEVALWASSSYISVIEFSNRSKESNLIHKQNYINEVRDMIVNDFASKFPDIGIGFFWQEWYGKLHDTDFPSVFFPKENLKSKLKTMISDLKREYPKLQLMPYINGLLYNKFLADFDTKYKAYALKDQNQNLFTYLPRGDIDLNFPNRIFARMDPTAKPWQNIIQKASSVVLNELNADGINIDQVTASAPKEDMDKTHKHPLAGGHWWRDGYDSMFSKIDSSITDEKYITSEGANEFLSNHVDGFFVHWDGVDNMVGAYQVVYGGRVQLFGLQMRTNKYSKDIFYMLYGQSFVNGLGLGMITTWITQDKTHNAPIAYGYVRDLAWMRYHLREFLSYGTRERDLVLRGDIPTISDSIKDTRASEEPDSINGKITISMPSVMHSVYKSEDRKKVAFIFTNISRFEDVSFSFDIDGGLYGFDKKLKVTTKSAYHKNRTKIMPNNFTQDITLKPLERKAFIIQ
jgi:hypothetical protein